MPVPDYMPKGEVKLYVGIRTSNRRMRAYDKDGNEVPERRQLIGSVQIKR